MITTLLFIFRTVISELWKILAEVTTKYMDDFQEINEGNALEHNFKTVESVVMFPFMYLCSEDGKQVSFFHFPF